MSRKESAQEASARTLQAQTTQHQMLQPLGFKTHHQLNDSFLSGERCHLIKYTRGHQNASQLQKVSTDTSQWNLRTALQDSLCQRDAESSHTLHPALSEMMTLGHLPGSSSQKYLAQKVLAPPLNLGLGKLQAGRDLRDHQIQPRAYLKMDPFWHLWQSCQEGNQV